MNGNEVVCDCNGTLWSIRIGPLAALPLPPPCELPHALRAAIAEQAPRTMSLRVTGTGRPAKPLNLNIWVTSKNE
jgi:hypothetical protein